jgi:3-phenylpropionate/cinnamic acid dioxygenase small subunit
VVDDVQAIKNLLFRYAELIDFGDVDGVGALFEHATYRTAGFERAELRGAEAVADQIRSLVILYDGTPSTKHVISNVIVEIDSSGDGASARSYFTVLQSRPDLPLQPILAGRYQDRFERVGGVWRFTDRLIHIDFVGNVSRHVPMLGRD